MAQITRLTSKKSESNLLERVSSTNPKSELFDADRHRQEAKKGPFLIRCGSHFHDRGVSRAELIRNIDVADLEKFAQLFLKCGDRIQILSLLFFFEHPR